MATDGDEESNVKEGEGVVRPLEQETWDPYKRPDAFKSTTQEVLCVITLTMATSLMSINNGSLVVSLPAIGDDFGISGGTLSWSLSASALATGSFLLASGQVADLFGRRRMLLFSYVFFTVCSVIAGFMKNYIVFFLFRGFQGLCGATAVTAAAGILGATYPPNRRKNYAMAAFASGAPVGFVVGILAGGICAQILDWYTVLWFAAIVYAFFSIAAYFFVPKDPALDWGRIKSTLPTLDYGGAILAISGFILFVFSLSQADGAPEGWGTPYIIALLIIGALLIISFCTYEAYIPKRPLMPMEIWTYPGFALCMAIAACGWIDFSGTLSYYATLYFQELREASPILTTAYFVPQAIAGILVNIFAGYALDRIPGRILMIVAMLGFTAAALLWSFVQLDTLYWAIPFPAFILVVVGADITYNVANLHALSTVDKKLQSTAAGVFNTCLQLSTSVGLAASAAVVNSVVTDQTTATKKEILEGYRAGYYFALGIAGLGLILSFFLKVGTKGGKK